MALELKNAWRKEDPAFERDAKALWTRQGVTPQDSTVDERAKELCVVAYDGDMMAGLTTVALLDYKPLRQRFAFFRVRVDDSYRRANLMRELNQETLEVMEQWSLDNPDEKVAGLMTTYVADFLNAPDRDRAFRLPVSERMGLIIVGYTADNQQIRVRWFDHALL